MFHQKFSLDTVFVFSSVEQLSFQGLLKFDQYLKAQSCSLAISNYNNGSSSDSNVHSISQTDLRPLDHYLKSLDQTYIDYELGERCLIWAVEMVEFADNYLLRTQVSSSAVMD